MNSIPRPLAAGCLRLSSSPAQPLLQQQQRRLISTGRRTRKLLNQPPAPFLGGPSYITGSSGRSRTASTPAPATDYLVYNPPPSAPNVYHTPLKFLPPSDLRHRLASSSSPSASPASSTSAHPSSTAWPLTTPLPTAYRTPLPKKTHLTPTDFDEMRKLRKEDPAKWTLNRLAERFQTHTLFAGRVTSGVISEEQRKEAARPHDEMRKKWGRRRREAREDKGRRREEWGLDK
jgi:hypothetical protein